MDKSSLINYLFKIKLITMPPKKKHISINGLILSAFMIISAIVFLTESDKSYWTLILFIPLFFYVIRNTIKRESKISE